MSIENDPQERGKKVLMEDVEKPDGLAKSGVRNMQRLMMAS